MANVSVVINNLVDGASVTAKDWLLLTPPERVQTPHIAERWKSQPGSSSWFLIDLGSVQPIDTVAFFGLSKPSPDLPLLNVSLGASSVARVRISSTDPSGAAGDLYDVQTVGEIFEGIIARALPAPVNGRYVRIDASDAGAAAILMGGACVGLRSEFGINPSYGMSRAVVDRSTAIEASGGQTFTRPSNYYRTLDMNFEWVREEQRWTLLDQIDTVLGTHSNILAMVDWQSSYLARDTIFGLVADVTPVVQPYFDIVSKALRIKGRL